MLLPLEGRMTYADGQGETHFDVRVGGPNVPPHDAPQHYISIILSDEAEVVTSDGEAGRLRPPGDVIFFDDLTGKGHATRAITDLVVVFVNQATAQGR